MINKAFSNSQQQAVNFGTTVNFTLTAPLRERVELHNLRITTAQSCTIDSITIDGETFPINAGDVVSGKLILSNVFGSTLSLGGNDNVVVAVSNPSADTNDTVTIVANGHIVIK